MNRKGSHVTLAVLSSPFFVLSLATLIVNDWLLKPWLHDWLTGKLSDFSGLIVLSSLMLIVFARYTNSALVGVAILFTLWKSPFSQAFIDFCNSLSVIQVHRTVDFTDIWALMVLPLADANFQRHRERPSNRWLVYPLGGLTLFAVLATSAIPVIDGGEAQLPALDGGSAQYIAELYQTIDSFATEQGLSLEPGSVDQFHRRYASARNSLQINYDPVSKTLFYGFGPTSNYFPLGGVSVGPDVRKMEDAFIKAISSRFPDLQFGADKLYAAEGGGQLGVERTHSAEFNIVFPDAHLDGSGCVPPDDSNPDVKRALQIADDFASEHSLVPGKRIWQSPGCPHLLTRYYVSGGVVGPGLESYGLIFSVSPEFNDLKMLDFGVEWRTDTAADNADLAKQLYSRFLSEPWKSDKVEVHQVQGF